MPKIGEGHGGTYGLIRYLYGPGDHNEHTDPHMVASWNDFAPDPGRDSPHTYAKLAAHLDLPVKALPPEKLVKKTKTGEQKPKETNWHCSVRAHPTDRHLTDDEWADIARRIVAAAGIAPAGDTKACRWVAVRHADDHIHIAATLVRHDGRFARRNFDFKNVQAEARRIEADYGLYRVNPGDGTAAKNTTSQERFKAERLGLERPARDQLREYIRQAVAGAANEEEFFTRLARAGVRVNQRIAPSGDITGYSVALPGDHNRDQQPIWFSGSKLAPDLSLPQIRKRLTAATDPADQPDTNTTPPKRSRPARALRTATTTAENALTILGDDDDGAAAATLIGIGEILDALAQTAPTNTRTELREAARSFERATRSHTQAQHAHNRALRQAARDIVHAGPAHGNGEDGGTAAMILDILVLAVIASAHWHSARNHAQQAAASRQAAQHLRAAYGTAASSPLAAMRAHGQNLPATTRARLADTIRTVLPDHADRIQTELNWPALAFTLAQAQHAGHDTTALLHRAVEKREIHSADSLSDVLVWRLRNDSDLPASVSAPRSAKRSTSRSTATARLPTYTPPTTPSTSTSRAR